jgi:hypothetical protein
MSDESLPDSLALDDAFRAAYYLTDQSWRLSASRTQGSCCSSSICSPTRHTGRTGRAPSAGHYEVTRRAIRSRRTSIKASRSSTGFAADSLYECASA